MGFIDKTAVGRVQVFRWIDFITFGIVGIVTNLILGYFLFQSGFDLQTKMLLGCVGLAFWLPYVGTLLTRASWKKNVTYITKHGIPVITNGFPIARLDVEQETDRAIADWNYVLERNDSEESIQDVIVTFKKHPVAETGTTKRKLNGFLKAKNAIIGYKPDKSLHNTALHHELGHEIHRDWVGYYSNSESHKFMRKHGLI